MPLCSYGPIPRAPLATGGEGGSGGEFRRLEKWRNSPPPKFSRRVANTFTASSDVGQYSEFGYVQRCARRREGTKMCLFATCSGCVTGMHWN